MIGTFAVAAIIIVATPLLHKKISTITNDDAPHSFSFNLPTLPTVSATVSQVAATITFRGGGQNVVAT